MTTPLLSWSDAEIRAILTRSRRWLRSMTDDLTASQLLVPCIPSVNPFTWEVGHVTWFLERWVLRELNGDEPIRGDGDEQFDSSGVPHDTRWHQPQELERVNLYADEVFARVDDLLAGGRVSPEHRYYVCWPCSTPTCTWRPSCTCARPWACRSRHGLTAPLANRGRRKTPPG